MCGPEPALHRLLPGGGRFTRAAQPCRSRSDRDAPVAAHTCAARRRPSAGRCRGGRSCRASCTTVQVSPRARRAGGGTHMCGPAQALRRPLPGSAILSRELHSRAGIAAIAMRRWRHTHVRSGAGPPPAVAGEGDLVARAAQPCRSRRYRDAPVAAHICAARCRPTAGRDRRLGGWSRRASCTAVQVSPLSRRAGGGTHMCGPALALRRPLPGGGGRSARAAQPCRSRRRAGEDEMSVARPGPTRARLGPTRAGPGGRFTRAAQPCRSRRESRDRDAPVAAHICAARRWPSTGRCRKGRSLHASCTAVQVSQRSRRAGGGTHMCGPAQALRRPLPERAVASRELHSRAGLAAIATRRWRHTHVRPGAGPLYSVL